jgi:plastocyanin
MWIIGQTASCWRRIGLAVGAIAIAGLTGAVPALGIGGPAGAGTAAVNIANFAFTPKALRITADTTVVWKNADDSPHRIAASDGAYASAALDTGDSYAHNFAVPGIYKYICSIHPYMRGTIIVNPTSPKS